MMMRPTVSVLALAMDGCEFCGPPAEPLIDTVIDVEVTPAPNDYLHIEMLNADGAHVTIYSVPASVAGPRSTHSLGNCDGYPQHSGDFTIRGWVNAQAYDAVEPAPTDPQGMTTVAVTCNDGCYAAHDVHVYVRAQ
jgi:hypothetical protein